MPATPSPQPDQVEMPTGHELMESDIQENIPELIDVLDEVLSDFDAWATQCS